MRELSAIFLVSVILASLATRPVLAQAFSNVPDLAATEQMATLRQQMDDLFPSFVTYNSQGTQIRHFSTRENYLRMQNQWFKILDGESYDAIAWQSRNSAASNVYYHTYRFLMFLGRLERRVGRHLINDYPITIRVNMQRDYTAFREDHFSDRECFNYSRVTPEGEVWFHAPRREYRDDRRGDFFRHIPFFRRTRLATDLAPIDTARDPATIYHELVHLITGAFLGLNWNTVLGEAISDYYAFRLVGDRPLGITSEFLLGVRPVDLAQAPENLSLQDYYTDPDDFHHAVTEWGRWLYQIEAHLGERRFDRLLWKVLPQMSSANLTVFYQHFIRELNLSDLSAERREQIISLGPSAIN